MINLTFFCPQKVCFTDFIKPYDNFIEEFVFEDETGHISIETSAFACFENIKLFFNLFFHRQIQNQPIYDTEIIKIFDISDMKNEIISFEDLEKIYTTWIYKSGHENTMDEYGMLLGIIGFIKRNTNKNIILRVEKV